MDGFCCAPSSPSTGASNANCLGNGCNIDDKCASENEAPSPTPGVCQGPSPSTRYCCTKGNTCLLVIIVKLIYIYIFFLILK